MNVMLDDGTVRCADCFDASTYACLADLPCLYCGKITPEPKPVAQTDQEWLEAVSSLVVDTPRREIQLAKVQCEWCCQPSAYVIIDELSTDERTNVCYDHGQEWHPDLFPQFTITCGTCESVTPTPGPWNVHVTWCDDCVSHGRHLPGHFRTNAAGERELITDSHS